MDSSNLTTLQKMLAVACHPNTSDAEALSALRSAERYANRLGKSVSDLILGMDTPTYRSLISTPIPKFLNQIGNLEKQIADLNVQMSKSDKEIKRLEQELKECRQTKKRTFDPFDNTSVWG